MYCINGVMKYVEQDDFDKGCIGNNSECSISINLRSATIEDLLKQFASFFGVEVKDLSLDVCDEIGRIEAQLQENDDGNEPSQAQLHAWKQGEGRMWAATYTGYVYECKPVSVLP